LPAETAHAGGLLGEWFGPVWGAAVGAGGTVIIGRLKDMVLGHTSCLDKIDECANLAERQLRLHGKNQADPVSMVGVFAARSELGIMTERQFGKKNKGILDALGLYSDALDACDPEATVGMKMGGEPQAHIDAVRICQQALRSAFNKSNRGAFAKIVGRKAAG